MKKLLITVSLASVMTFGLFAFMAYLVHNDNVSIAKPLPVVVIDVYQTEKQELTEEIDRSLPEPPKPPEAIPQVVMVADEAQVDGDISYTQTAIDLPTTQNTLTGMSMGRDQEARPIVRISPKYPIIAAREGIEGWVKLAFDIDKLGAVVNVTIVDSQPKRIFDKAARRALKRWKYKAKSLNGELVYQAGQSVQLDFNMSQNI